MEEVESPLEEIPSMVKLDATQLWEVVLPIFGAKCMVGSGYRKDYSRTSDTSDESAVLAGDGSQDSRVESGHEVQGRAERGRSSILY